VYLSVTSIWAWPKTPENQEALRHRDDGRAVYAVLEMVCKWKRTGETHASAFQGRGGRAYESSCRVERKTEHDEGDARQCGSRSNRCVRPEESNGGTDHVGSRQRDRWHL
jgi:hypothetical protein